MRNKAQHLIKNFSYAITSNIVSFAISTLIVFIIPKIIGVLDYGYWQLYLFYLGYVGFLHFGWNDGIYLRYGGKLYDELDKNLFYSQFYLLFVLQLIIGIAIFTLSYFITEDTNRAFVIRLIAFSLVLENTRYFLLFILQATSKFKEYSLIILLDRILYILLIVLFILFGIRNFKLLIFADIVGKFVSFVYASYICNDIVFKKISLFRFTISESIKNIFTGINLMFANIASKLIIGVTRFGIERNWGIAIFGKVSLVLSISNMLMLFLNTIGLVLFPVLRRTKQENLASIYNILRDILMVILLGVLVIYYPVKEILLYWLPKYTDSLIYIALLLPISIYEGKMALLINTYLKTYRKEKTILRINIYSLFLSILTTISIILIFKNLEILILSIVFILAFRSIFAEILLSKIIKINFLKNIILEIVLSLIFIYSGWFIDSWVTPIVYSLAYAIYLFVKRKDIKLSIGQIKYLLKQNY